MLSCQLEGEGSLLKAGFGKKQADVTGCRGSQTFKYPDLSARWRFMCLCVRVSLVKIFFSLCVPSGKAEEDATAAPSRGPPSYFLPVASFTSSFLLSSPRPPPTPCNLPLPLLTA